MTVVKLSDQSLILMKGHQETLAVAQARLNDFLGATAAALGLEPGDWRFDPTSGSFIKPDPPEPPKESP